MLLYASQDLVEYTLQGSRERMIATPFAGDVHDVQVSRHAPPAYEVRDTAGSLCLLGLEQLCYLGGRGGVVLLASRASRASRARERTPARQAIQVRVRVTFGVLRVSQLVARKLPCRRRFSRFSCPFVQIPCVFCPLSSAINTIHQSVTGATHPH